MFGEVVRKINFVVFVVVHQKYKAISLIFHEKRIGDRIIKEDIDWMERLQLSRS